VAETVTQKDGNQPKTDHSIAGTYMAKLVELLECDSNKPKFAASFAKSIGSKHFLSVLEIAAEMERLYREMRSVLDEFTGRRYFLFNVLTVEHLAMVMKLYVISWYTMLDLVARLVNVTFRLGIADRDVTLRLILNNHHVRLSRIPEIVHSYEQTRVVNDLRQ
jgi:hypothetical protein